MARAYLQRNLIFHTISNVLWSNLGLSSVSSWTLPSSLLSSGEAISLKTRLLSMLLLEKRLVQLLGLAFFRLTQIGSKAAPPAILIARGGNWGLVMLLARQTLLTP
jgi:hypothetical protein